MRNRMPKVMRIAVLAVLLAAGFVGLRAFAQAPAATADAIPAAPPAGINASKLPDTNGVHLGMTQDEALTVMKGLYPGNLLVIKKDKFDNGQEWTVSLEGKAAETCNGGCSDDFGVYFSSPPNPPQVIHIMRQMHLAPGKQPTMEATMASLRQKYGKELASTKSGVGVMAWAFDEQGQPINPQGPSNFSPADCAGGGAPGVGPLSTPLPDLVASLNRNLCSRNVYVTAELGAQSIQGTPVVVSIYLILGEKSLTFRDAVATKQYWDAKQQQQQQQQMKNAQQQKAPSL
jgi:hypothetical protein